MTATPQNTGQKYLTHWKRNTDPFSIHGRPLSCLEKFVEYIGLLAT